MRLVLDAPLTDGDVAVRQATPEDGRPYAAAFAADADLARLLGIPAAPDEAAGRERFADLARAAEDGRGAELAVVDPATGEWLGGITVHHVVEPSARCELGLLVAAGHRRRGVAARAMRLVLGWLFATVGVARVEMTTTPENAAIPPLAATLGFAHEGTLRRRDVEHGRRVDILCFGLLRDEWRG